MLFVDPREGRVLVGDHMEDRHKERRDKYDRKGREDPDILCIARAQACREDVDAEDRDSRGNTYYDPLR